MPQARSATRPMVLIIRDPDYETQVVTQGEVDYEVIDLGSSYDIGSSYSPSDTGIEVMRNDLERCRALAAQYPGDIADALSGVIERLAESLGDDEE